MGVDKRMQISPVKKYLNSNVRTPYFLFISDGRYKAAMDELKGCGLDFVQLSSFCRSDDKMPDIDELFTYIEEADENTNNKKFVITGLGEFLALCGKNEAVRTLSWLKDLFWKKSMNLLFHGSLTSFLLEMRLLTE